MSRSSRIRRHLATVEAPPTLRGYDLKRLELTDIEDVSLDLAEGTVTVTVQVPVHTDGLAAYEESIDLDEPSVPGYLRHAALVWTQAVLRAVRERATEQRELPCATCTGACCGIVYKFIRLTAEDVERLRAAGLVSEDTVEFYEDGMSFSGHVGEIKLVQDEEGETRCPWLHPWGCGIYEHRPAICRDYSPWDCEVHAEDPEKVAGHVKLGEPDGKK